MRLFSYWLSTKKDQTMKKTSKILTAFVLTFGFLGALPVVANAVEFTTSTIDPVSAVPKKDKTAINAYKLAKQDYLAALEIFKAAKSGYKAQKAAYKILMEEIKPALQAYSAAKKVIGQTFRSSVASARTIFENALAADSSVESQLAAKLAFKQAKITAAANRADAIAALGAKPVKPAEPVKPIKPVKPTKPASE